MIIKHKNVNISLLNTYKKILHSNKKFIFDFAYTHLISIKSYFSLKTYKIPVYKYIFPHIYTYILTYTYIYIYDYILLEITNTIYLLNIIPPTISKNLQNTITTSSHILTAPVTGSSMT